jgi:periplasmic divalent cation tolerance protein
MLDIWINCPDRSTARAIGRTLLEERLAACVNVYPEIESLYRWKGALEAAVEVPLLVKTQKELFDAVCERVTTLHPYDTPAIHAVAVERVAPAYGAWLREETGR